MADDDENTIPQDTPPPPPERRPALVFLRGELLAAPIPLDRSEVTLGRALEADIRINDPRASRLHARISVVHEADAPPTYRISDLGSTNGTLLNGRPVTEAVLQDGDKVTIGEHLLRFELLDDIDREYQRQIYRLLAHDELTGLLTSKSFFSELRREAGRAEVDGRPFCVLMMDLDHFKQVNDTYGHLVGSQTLEEVGALITRALRAGDVAARFGGEEFAAFLLDADGAQGLVAAERVRTTIEAHTFAAVRREAASADEPRPGFHVTISVGVASFPQDARDPIELMELADTALYRAKQTGRNRVVAYAPASDSATARALPARNAPREPAEGDSEEE